MKKLIFMLVLAFSMVWVANSQPTFVLVMSKGHLAKSQAYFMEPVFPENKVMQKYVDGFHIQDVNYGASIWTVTMSDQTFYQGQVHATSAVYPEEFIAEYTAQEYRITSLGYGNGSWAVVMSLDSSITDQFVHSDSTFSTDWLTAQADSGYFLTDVARAYKDCKIVMSKGTRMTDQQIIYDTRLPAVEISQRLAGPDWRISHLSYQDNKWIAAISKNTIHRSQIWSTKNVIPANAIKEGWEQGFVITQYQKVALGKEKLPPPAEVLAAKTVERPKVSTSCKKITRASHINTMADQVLEIKGDQERMALTQQLITDINACVKAEQVGFLCDLFEKDATKLEFLKWAFDHTYDLGEYAVLREKIRTKDVLKEFDAFLQ
ncbi:hypothetical protein N9933_02645 [bacterium]|nr:hypothetical protein [bacterium]